MTILGFSFRCIRWLISPMAMAILFIHAMVDYDGEDEKAAEYFRQEAKKWFAGR